MEETVAHETHVTAPGRVRTRSRSVVAGWTLTALAVLFLAFDSLLKLLEAQAALDGTVQLGYPAESAFGIGVILAICVIAYVVPATSVLGAVLLTGYLGGAVATHVRVGSPLLTHTLFPIYVALFVWGGLLLREPRLQALFPLRRRV